MRQAGEYEKSVSMSVDRSLRSARESEAAAAASGNAMADLRAKHAAELATVRAEASQEREVLMARLGQVEETAEKVESRSQGEINRLRDMLRDANKAASTMGYRPCRFLNCLCDCGANCRPHLQAMVTLGDDYTADLSFQFTFRIHNLTKSPRVSRRSYRRCLGRTASHLFLIRVTE